MHFHITMLAGPVIGAIIGYFTNYLAVKMLFRPRREIRIGGWRVPMTPGVIPKGKARLARAIGKAVSENLLTKEDLGHYLLNEEMSNTVVDKVVDFLNKEIKDDVLMISGIAGEDYEEKKNKAIDAVSNFMIEEVKKLPIREKVNDTIIEVANEKLAELTREGGMMGMVALMVPEEKIKELADSLGWKAERYIEENAFDYVHPVLHEKAAELEGERIMDLLNRFNLEDDRIREEIESIYAGLVNDNIGKVLGYLDIATMIETKINDMSVEELETLVLSVMKKELNMIITLGFFIGFVIGIVNSFI